MLVRSAVRSNSTSSSEHNAYLASTLIQDDAAPAKLTESGGVAQSPAATAPPTGSDSVINGMPPVERASSRKKTNLFPGSPPRQHDLAIVQNLEAEIAALVLQIAGVEQDVEEVQEAIASGSSYRGRRGEALGAVEEGLVRKEQLLREKERQLRDEKMLLLRLQVSTNSQQPKMASTQYSNGEGSVPTGPRKRVSFVMTSSYVGDPAGEKKEQRRLSKVNELIEKRRSMSGHSLDSGGGSTDAVITIHKIEEDNRLLARLGALEMPILVSTLLAGFTLAMFDVASTDLSRRLAVLAFGLESSASIVLCLIAFRGQQLYSYATDVNPLTREFLRRVRPVTVVALLAFALGVVAFVLAFVIEASEELGASWLAVVGLVFFPTLVAGVLFAVSTVNVKRYSIPQPQSE